ncbi:MAG TPA: Wzz/FepE/Etk N-terminal domain-containing protein, partial [Bacteroidia bacterium]|nr:Wzz/FepE/Etk N-terminal domain-containing protein [Bacteroidia bacterium]
MLQAQLNDKNDTFERYKERLTNFSGEFELGLFLFIAKKSIAWVILFFVLAGAGAWLYLRYSEANYQASAIMQINSDNTAKMLNVQNIYELDDQNELASAVEMIRSKVFLRRVLAQMPLQVSYYAQGDIKTNEHYKSSPYSIGVNLKSESIYGTRIDIKFSSKADGGEIFYTLDGQTFRNNFLLNEWIEFPQVSLLITADPARLKQMLMSEAGANDYYFSINSIDHLADSYINRLNVTLANEAAKTIGISFTD